MTWVCKNCMLNFIDLIPKINYPLVTPTLASAVIHCPNCGAAATYTDIKK